MQVPVAHHIYLDLSPFSVCSIGEESEMEIIMTTLYSLDLSFVRTLCRTRMISKNKSLSKDGIVA